MTRGSSSNSLALPLSPEIIARLEARTEGWVTGLRLVALALQARHEPEAIAQFVDTFSGSHRHILEYLAAEVLAAQSPAMQEFLLRTTFLSRLCAPLCDAILERADSARLLEHLDQANLFLIPLEEEPRPAPHPFAAVTWYRYHALFAEAIQVEAGRRLGADCLRQLLHKASLWYEAQGALAEAIESALVAQQFERAALLLEQIIAPQLMHNEFHTLRRWIAQLPAATLRPHPDLCFSYAIAILFTSDRYAPATQALLEPPLAMAEEQWQRAGNQIRLGELLAFRSLVAWFQRDLADSFAHARQALALLPVENRQWRGISQIFPQRRNAS